MPTYLDGLIPGGPQPAAMPQELFWGGPPSPEDMAPPTSRFRAAVGGLTSGAGGLAGGLVGARMAARIPIPHAAVRTIATGIGFLGGSLLGRYGVEATKHQLAKGHGYVGQAMRSILASQEKYPYTSLAAEYIPEIPIVAGSVGKLAAERAAGKLASAHAVSAAGRRLGASIPRVQAKEVLRTGLLGAGMSTAFQAGMGALRGEAVSDWINPMQLGLDALTAGLSTRAAMGRVELGKYYRTQLRLINEMEKGGFVGAYPMKVRLMQKVRKIRTRGGISVPEGEALKQLEVGQTPTKGPRVHGPETRSPITGVEFRAAWVDQNAAPKQQMMESYGLDEAMGPIAAFEAIPGSLAKAERDFNKIKDLVWGPEWSRKAWGSPGLAATLRRWGLIEPLSALSSEAPKDLDMAMHALEGISTITRVQGQRARARAAAKAKLSAKRKRALTARENAAIDRRFAKQDFKRPIGAILTTFGANHERQAIINANKLLADIRAKPHGAEVIRRAHVLESGSRALLQELRDNFIIDDDLFNVLQSTMFYQRSQFLQYMPERQMYNAKGGRIDVPDPEIHALAGGSLRTMETDSRQLSFLAHILTNHQIARNQANLELVGLARRNPQYPGFLRLATDNELKPKWLAHHPLDGDHVLLRARTLDPATNKSKLVGVVADKDFAMHWATGTGSGLAPGIARWMELLSMSPVVRAMATGMNPAFATANIFRDAIHSWLTTDIWNAPGPIGDLLPITGFYDMARQYKATWKDAVSLAAGTPTPLAQQYVKMGVESTFLSSMPKGLRAVPEIEGVANILSMLPKISENWTRLAMFKQGMDKGLSAKMAAAQARRYIDFNQGGGITKFLSHGIPYLNAGVQAVRGLARYGEQHPLRLTAKLVNLAIPTAGLYIFNRMGNPEALDSVPDFIKADNWVVTTPFWRKDKKTGEKLYTYLTIPKDQNVRGWTTGVEAMAHRLMTGEAPPKAFHNILRAASKTIPFADMSLLPPTVAAAVGAWVNWDFWLDDNIWRGKDVIPEQEIIPGVTSRTAMKLGKQFSVSPARLSYMMQTVVPKNPFQAAVSGIFDVFMGQLDEDEREQVNISAVKMMQGATNELTRRLVKETRPQYADPIYDTRNMLAEGYTSARERMIDAIEGLADKSPASIVRALQPLARKWNAQAQVLLRPVFRQFKGKEEELGLNLVTRYTFQPQDIPRIVAAATQTTSARQRFLGAQPQQAFTVDTDALKRQLGLPPKRKLSAAARRRKEERDAARRKREVSLLRGLTR